MNIFTDKYFTKAKLIAKHVGLNPVVSYRFFARCSGIAAMEPLKLMAAKLLKDKAELVTWPEGQKFEAGDTIAILKGKFQDVVEYEPLLLWWTILPSVCALEAQKIYDESQDMALCYKKEVDVIAMENRHNFSAEVTALTSYGARVGGITLSSCEIASNPLAYLSYIIDNVYLPNLNYPMSALCTNKAVGTMPHALLAIFKGDYAQACQAYKSTFPSDQIIVLNDYNNKEIDDSLTALKELGKELYGVRCDTCGENYPQLSWLLPPTERYSRGISRELVINLRRALDENEGNHVKICVSSGFDSKKIDEYFNTPIDVIGTGSFIPKWPTATADIFEVDGVFETKKGREWGFQKNMILDRKLSRLKEYETFPSEPE